MSSSIQIKIRIQAPFYVSTQSRKGYRSVDELRKQASVVIKNRIDPHVQQIFNPDEHRVLITDECLSEKMLKHEKLITKAHNLGILKMTEFPVACVPARYQAISFIIKMTFNNINPRIFVLKNVYDKFIASYNETSTGTKEQYMITEYKKIK